MVRVAKRKETVCLLTMDGVVCAAHLGDGPRPPFQLLSHSKTLVVGIPFPQRPSELASPSVSKQATTLDRPIRPPFARSHRSFSPARASSSSDLSSVLATLVVVDSRELLVHKQTPDPHSRLGRLNST